jgi:hypothetical protein
VKSRSKFFKRVHRKPKPVFANSRWKAS